MKKIHLLLLLIFLVSKAKSQELLDADTTTIKKYVVAHGGIVKGSRIVEDGIMPGPYHLFICTFPKAKQQLNGVGLMSFLSKPYNKCYKYVTYYSNASFMKPLIDKFDNPNSGLVRQGKDLKWINKEKKYQIAMSKPQFGTTEKVNPFILEISKQGIK